jgi:hypothetical protein
VLDGCDIVTFAVSLQPLLSVTITEYVPAVRFVAVAVYWKGLLFQKYEYGGVPPVVSALASPVGCPKQVT